MSQVKALVTADAQHRAMPWDESYYPASMARLPTAVRRKAIEIANALLEGGHPEGQSIRIGIASARKWAARHCVKRVLRTRRRLISA